MAAKKPTAQAAAKQPAGSTQAATQPADESKERGPAKEGTSSGEIKLEVVTRLPRRIRGGVIVTQEPREVVVTEEVAALIEADPHISATRK